MPDAKPSTHIVGRRRDTDTIGSPSFALRPSTSHPLLLSLPLRSRLADPLISEPLLYSPCRSTSTRRGTLLYEDTVLVQRRRPALHRTPLSLSLSLSLSNRAQKPDVAFPGPANWGQGQMEANIGALARMVSTLVESLAALSRADQQ